MGRLITVPLLVFGLLLIALPTFVLGREFSIVWDLMKEQEVGAALTGPEFVLIPFVRLPPSKTSSQNTFRRRSRPR